LAVSFILPAIAYLVYRWQRSRAQDEEEVVLESESATAVQQLLDQQERVNKHQELQEKLQSFCRSRLDTLEEETLEEKEHFKAVEEVEQAATTKNSSEAESVHKAKTAKVEPIFGSTDIRYRHKPISDSIVIDKNDSDGEAMVEKVIDEVVMVLDEREEVVQEVKVPSVLAALQDPLCLASPPSPNSYSSSPVKSEASSEGRQSTEWSDLIEQDERESFQKVLTSKLSGLDLNDGRARGGDSGVVSPSEDSTEGERERLLSETNSKTRSHSGEDAGIGSEQGDLLSEAGAGLESHLEEAQLMSYQFHIPDYLCGKLIGQNGIYIKKLKEECRCNIILKETEGVKPKKAGKMKNRRNGGRQQTSQGQGGDYKVCSIEGTRASIDKCLDIVKLKFIEHRDEVSFEQVNSSKGTSLSMHTGSVSLSLAEGCMHEVFVSSIVGGGHVFLQQPYHPTFHALERLDACMAKLYSSCQCPALPSPLPVNTVCVAAYEGGWYRCQVVSVDEASQQCDIKYLDYGGYHTLPIDDLRQIRTDFLSLPFQAIECYLANISPKDDENVSAFVLEELIANQIVQARMIGTNEAGVPMIHLYRATNGQTTMVNKELVDRSCANWIETTIVQLDPSEVATN